jgi:phasin
MNTKIPYEVPEEMKDFAEKSVVQARKAFDGFIGAAHKAVDAVQDSQNSVQFNAADMTKKAIAYAEQNVAAAFDLAQRMVRAKDVNEMMQLQAEFARSQFASMQAQMKDVGSAVQKAATTAQATAQKTATETAAAMQKSASDAVAAVQKATTDAGKRK